MSKHNSSGALLGKLRCGDELTFSQQLSMAFGLSLPSMLSQISTIMMEYIDASMVGHLGADASASIGLVSSTTWLFGGIIMAAAMGFSVQAAHAIGAGDEKKARSIMRQGLVFTQLIAWVLTVIALCISPALPRLLGGDESIRRSAAQYFFIFVLNLPAYQISCLSGGLLQASGNMRAPAILNALTCLMDIIFNGLLIFPSGSHTLLGISFYLPGAGLGVAGAAMGTTLSEFITALLMLGVLLISSPEMKLRRSEKLQFSAETIKNAFRIALPVGAEQVMMSGAQVMSTRIVSPLGNEAIAANSFAVTAESLCYMPGYGISSAAVTIVGQSIGAGRRDMARRLGIVTTGLGMAVMTVTGVLMYAAAPAVIGMLTPVEGIRLLGARVLRIEAFAEPLFAASIVANGVFRGAGDTLVPSLMNFASMWLVRLPLAWFLSTRMGLAGVWTAMCAELCVRGIVFLIRLFGKKWTRRSGSGGAVSSSE